MVVDTSVIMAILLEERDAARFLEILVAADGPVMAAPSLLEASIGMQARHGDQGIRDLDALITRLGIRIVPFGEDEAKLARLAFRQFGKGRHPASLNFGDCIAFAVAQSRGLPLLFKGNDFALTGIRGVIA